MDAYTPDDSWLRGKYDFGKGIVGEIDPSLPYVSVEGDGLQYFSQGDEASEDIKNIHTLWLQDGRRTTQSAFKKWISLYL